MSFNRGANPPMQRLFFLFLPLVIMMRGDADPSDEKVLQPLPDDGWSLVTDAVMGGMSSGRMTRQTRDGRACTCLSGDVRTENNGGFMQLALAVDVQFARLAKGYDGIRLDVLGNSEQYGLHLRTRDLWLPWQSYRAAFVTHSTWQTVWLPFSEFVPYRTDRPLRIDQLKRLAVVAIGRAFAADICVAGVALYRGPG